MEKLLALSLRVSVIGIKLLLVLFLGVYYSLEDVGLYGVIAALASYSIYFLGLETHSSVNRQGIKNRSMWVGLIQRQYGVFLLSSIFFAIALSVYAYLFLDDFFLVGCLLALSLVEYSGQEIYRRYIALGCPFEASIFLFFRHGIWPLIFIGYFIFSESQPRVESIFIFWFLAGLLSNLVGGAHLRIVFFKDWLFPRLDFFWLFSVLKSSFLFLFSILILRSVNVADRLLVGVADSPRVLGVYVFYTSIAAAAAAVLNFTGAAQAYPALISAISKNDVVEYRRIRRKMLVSTLGVSVIVMLGIPIALVVLRLVFNSELLFFESEFLLFSLIISGIFLGGVNMFFHYILYCHGRDRDNLMSNFHSVALAAVFLAAFGLAWGLTANVVAAAVLVFYVFGILSKYLYSRCLGEEWV